MSSSIPKHSTHQEKARELFIWVFVLFCLFVLLRLSETCSLTISHMYTIYSNCFHPTFALLFLALSSPPSSLQTLSPHPTSFIL